MHGFRGPGWHIDCTVASNAASTKPEPAHLAGGRTTVPRRALALFALAVASAAPVATLKCPPDSVKVGPTCIDKYEASVWHIATTNRSLIRRIERGQATLAELSAAGAVQLGCTYAPYSLAPYPAGFPSDGNWEPEAGSSPPSPGVYALSIAGVPPSTCTSWFQAVQACALSGKRLIRNEEWQRAATGTPDPGLADDDTTTCVTAPGDGHLPTGSREARVSRWGVFDMIGNATEHTADWADRADAATQVDWTAVGGPAGNDLSAFGGNGGSEAMQVPASIRRGGSRGGLSPGVFFVSTNGTLNNGGSTSGFRCAR